MTPMNPEPMSVAEFAHLAMRSPDAGAYEDALVLTRALMLSLDDDPRFFDHHTGMFTSEGVTAMRARLAHALQIGKES